MLVRGVKMANREKIQNHISHLEEKHARLDTEINTLQTTHGDEIRIENLKKSKLRIKDEIEKHKKNLEKMG
jgi:hypothetical protein